MHLCNSIFKLLGNVIAIFNFRSAKNLMQKYYFAILKLACKMDFITKGTSWISKVKWRSIE